MLLMLANDVTTLNAEFCLHFSKFALVQSIYTLCKSIYIAEKGKIWGKNSYVNRFAPYANRFALMAEANLVQNQLCKSIYTLCKSICTVKMLKNALLKDILTWYLQNTNTQEHKAIFLVFWLVKQYIQD